MNTTESPNFYQFGKSWNDYQTRAVAARVLAEIFKQKLDEVMIDIPERYISEHIPSRLRKIMISPGLNIGLEDEKIGGDPWCGAFYGAPNKSMIEVMDRTVSFVLWPPTHKEEGWGVMMHLGKGELYQKDKDHRNGRAALSVEYSFLFRGELQAPPNGGACASKHVVTKDGVMFLNAQKHFTAGDAWDPEPGRPAETVFSIDGEIISETCHRSTPKIVLPRKPDVRDNENTQQKSWLGL